MNFGVALLVVAASGFVALSYEIAWFRVYSFLTGGTAGSFGLLLAAYLAGVALGSVAARRACEDDDHAQRRNRLLLPGILTLLASALGYLLIPYVAWHVTLMHWTASLPAVAAVAGLTGAILPMIAHFGIDPDERAGERLSLLYLANIIGCTAGSLVTGFVLLDKLPLRHVAVLLGVFGVALGVALVLASRPDPRKLAAWCVVGLLLGAAQVIATPALYDGIWPMLQRKEKFDGSERFLRVIQTRSGVITVDRDKKVYGGGIYDGQFTTSLTPDLNRIFRAYAIAAVHPKPAKVLMIGLSSGSWATVIVNALGVQRFDVIEINPGYLELIEGEPLVRPILHDQRTHIHVDDGRRWLAAHPGEKFDVIVQNTTFHWRGHITNLLSAEYMELVKARLAADGVFMFNTTAYRPAMKTACAAFSSGFRFLNFMYVSDRQGLVLNVQRWREALRAWRVHGKPTFEPGNPAHDKTLEELLSRRSKPRYFETCAEILDKERDEAPITDDNMRSEFSEPFYRSH